MSDPVRYLLIIDRPPGFPAAMQIDGQPCRIVTIHVCDSQVRVLYETGSIDPHDEGTGYCTSMPEHGDDYHLYRPADHA